MAFKLTKNNLFQSGKCWYEDEHNNTAFVKKEDGAFVIKIRFKNEKVKAAPIKVHIPIEAEDEGCYLHLDYSEPYGDDVQAGIDNFTDLLQKWINLMHDINYLGLDYKMIGKIVESETGVKPSDDDIAIMKLNRLSEYEETKDMIEASRNNA